MITEQKPVWDIFIRIFHWTLVIAFAASYFTEGDIYLHFYSGWYIIILIVLRILWGVVGTPYARFRDFVKSPTEIMAYVKSLKSNERSIKRYIGHNPLGGLMVITLLLSLSITCTTGVLLYTQQGKSVSSFLGHSPIDSVDDNEQAETKPITGFDTAVYDHDEDELSAPKEYQPSLEAIDSTAKNNDKHKDSKDETLKEVHDFFANFTLFLILLHVAGVVISSRVHGENLVLAMLTGKKSVNKK